MTQSQFEKAKDLLHKIRYYEDQERSIELDGEMHMLPDDQAIDICIGATVIAVTTWGKVKDVVAKSSEERKQIIDKLQQDFASL